MASVLLSHENQGEDKHVESILLPRSDTGSTPVSSTNKKDDYFLVVLFYCYSLKKRGIEVYSMPLFEFYVILNGDYSAIKISMIVLADLATGEPGPKIAATPALYKKS